MTKTAYRIRTAEFSSGALAHARILTNLFVDSNGALRCTALYSVRRPCTLRLRWPLDARSGRTIAQWESGDEPGSHLFQFTRLIHPGLSLYHLAVDASLLSAH